MIKTGIKVEHGNKRLVYQVESGIPMDWQGVISEMDQLISEESSLTIESPYVFFYFFLSPNDPDFDVADSWIGREVWGSDQDIEQNYKIEDFSKGIFWRFSFETEMSELTPTVIKHEFLKIVENCEDFANTWRFWVHKEKMLIGVDLFPKLG